MGAGGDRRHPGERGSLDGSQRIASRRRLQLLESFAVEVATEILATVHRALAVDDGREDVRPRPRRLNLPHDRWVTRGPANPQ